MNIYDENGYLNVETIINSGDWRFIFFIGGRGTGKTYGVLKYLLGTEKFFMILRRTQQQADIISNQMLSPLQPLSMDIGFSYKMEKLVKQIGLIKIGTEEEEEPIGFTAALSTFSNVRGFSGDRIEFLLYDEFNPEPHERLIKDEGQAFLNCYETINRNRELKGRSALTAILCGNSNRIDNPIIIEMGLLPSLVKAKQISKKYGHAIMKYPKRGILMIVFDDSPISTQKQNTALYQAAGDGDFSNMALTNEFTDDVPSTITSQNLKEYRLLTVIDTLCIYQHKSRPVYYVSGHRTGTPIAEYGKGSTELLRFQKRYGYLWRSYLKDQVLFENYAVEVLFKKLF